MMKQPLYILLVILTLICFSKPLQAREVVCGQVNGKDVMCNLDTHHCYRCKTKGDAKTLQSLFGLPDVVEYHCYEELSVWMQPFCEVTSIGGRTGGKTTGWLWSRNYTPGQECVIKNIQSQYTENCYSCQIVETLASAFLTGASKAYDVSKRAANAILTVAMLLWLGLFVLKNISSFSTVEPMKMLQELFIQFFKVFVAFTIINIGLATILHYTLEPLMLAGTSFGDTIMESNLNDIVDSKLSEAKP